MISKEDLQKMEAEARTFLRTAGVEGDVKVRKSEEDAVLIEATLAEPKLFIGERGQTLAEVQHLLRAIIRKKIPDLQAYISLDINEYKKNKESYLKEMAISVADEVALLKKEKELSPMPAAERRIVHMEVAERNDVASESRGEGQDRRVVIKPKGAE